MYKKEFVIKKIPIVEWTEKHTFMFFCFAIAIFVRFILLGKVPDGLNQDEAYAAYEAYSLLHFGRDSWGYAFPVYLTTWGSGMSIMNAYLMIPFMAIFGPSIFAVRLPQAILGIITVFAFYKLFRLLYPVDKTVSLIALFILAINPWHILMSRWALDCNMASAFFLFAFYFFVKGVKESKYYMFSAFFYGLALYCYALAWIFVPCFVLLQGIYLIVTKRFKWSKHIFFSVLIVALMAVPLILFVLVNSGRIGEVVTPFFSIPRMPVYRASEINLDGKKAKLFFFIKCLVLQNDGLEWNYAGGFGLYYIWGLPLALIGFISLIIRTVKGLRKREYHAEAMILIPVFTCIAFSCVIESNFSKMTLIHIPMISMIVIGIQSILTLLRKETFRRICLYAFCVIGALSVILFERFYFSDYPEIIADNFKTGFKECLEYADEINDGRKIYFNDYSSHPCVLFFDRIPVTDPELAASRNTGIAADHISNYVFNINEASEGDLCVIHSEYLPEWCSEENLLFESGRYMVVRR